MTIHATLPVSSLVGANLAWVRSDFGPMEDLITDVKAHGVKQPILVAPDYLVLDGARRLVAASQAGTQYATIIICHTWEIFVDNFKPMEPDAYPMTWLEIGDLINRVLRPIYQEYRYRTANLTRDLRREGKLPTPENPNIRQYNYSNFMVAVAGLLEVQPVHLKMLTDNVKTLHDLQATDPAVVGILAGAISEMSPEHRRDLSLIRVLKTVLHRYKRGTLNHAEAGNLLTAQVQASGAMGYARRKKNMLDEEAPVIALGVVRSFAELLNTVCAQGDDFRNFRPTTQYQKQEFKRAYESIVTSTGKLYRLRRRMESALTASDPGETEDKEPSDG